MYKNIEDMINHQKFIAIFLKFSVKFEFIRHRICQLALNHFTLNLFFQNFLTFFIRTI